MEELTYDLVELDRVVALYQVSCFRDLDEIAIPECLEHSVSGGRGEDIALSPPDHEGSCLHRPEVVPSPLVHLAAPIPPNPSAAIMLPSPAAIFHALKVVDEAAPDLLLGPTRIVFPDPFYQPVEAQFPTQGNF